MGFEPTMIRVLGMKLGRISLDAALSIDEHGIALFLGNASYSA